MHSGMNKVSKPIWFKLGLTMDTVKFYIFILVLCVTLTVIEGHWDARKYKLLCQLSPEVCNGFGCDIAYCGYFLVW